jgi:hypothetical protein
VTGRRWPVLLALVLVTAACAGGGQRESSSDGSVPDGREGSGDAVAILGETSDRLAEVTSGNLRFSMLAGAVDHERGDVGFSLEGPFDLEGGGLPVAELTHTQVVGETRATATFVSDGTRAYVVVDGQAYELDDEQAAALGTRTGSGDPDEEGLSGLRLERWVTDPQVVDAEGETTRITGGVDVATALPELLSFGARLGADDAGLRPASPGDGEALARSTRSAEAEVVTGSSDRLLRRLHLVVVFGAGDDVPEAYRSARMEVELVIDDPNEPVSVKAPADALPAAELPRG